MESIVKDFNVASSTDDETIKETDKAIKQIQDILVKQGSGILNKKDKTDLKNCLAELARVGDELKHKLESETAGDNGKLHKQFELIKETCELSNIVLKRRKTILTPNSA